MAKRFVEPDEKGKLLPQRVPTGAKHVFVARRLELDHRYHDDDPIQEADFTVTFANGFELKGRLDKTGKATLVGVPESVTVRFGPDAREYKRVDGRNNPDHREQFTDADFDALYRKYGG
jgi:type VI secretion system secreted protein VgrG